MGLKFSRLALDPFLYNGLNLPILQSLRKSPEEMEILHISAVGFVRMFATLLKISMKFYQFLLLLRWQYIAKFLKLSSLWSKLD